MKILPELDEQNRQIIAMLREQNELLRELRGPSHPSSIRS